MDNKKVEKIGVLTFWEFPEGMAPTTRILAYSKGLVMNGIEVEIFSFRRIFKDELNKKNIEKYGQINGVKYTYLHFFNSIGRNYKLLRVIDELFLRFKLFLKVYQSNKKKPFDNFFFSFDDLNSLSVYTRIFKFFSFPLIFIADEYPIPIRDFMKESVPDEMLVKYRKYHRVFKARILMSESLKTYYNHFVSTKPSFILNTIIDTDRFDSINNNEYSGAPYICYMGNMSLRKDDILTIIKAFGKVCNIYPALELHLYGTPEENDLVLIKELIGSLNLSNKVLIKGKVGFKDVPSILVNSTILVNAQPITKRAQGGFPTKLGEYLLSKKPSVFTDSGDISTYIVDKFHAYIVPPENVEKYADTLLYILENYEFTLSVANRGEALIRSKYDANSQSSLLLNFLNTFSFNS